MNMGYLIYQAEQPIALDQQPAFVRRRIAGSS